MATCLHSTHCSLDRAHAPHTVANQRVLGSANPSLKLHEPELLLAVPGVSSPNHHGRSEKGRLTASTPHTDKSDSTIKFTDNNRAGEEISGIEEEQETFKY